MASMDISQILSPNTLNPTATSGSATAKATTTGAAGTTGNSGLDGTTTGTTFLNLLVKELQNQDPTAPMDSTAMVGQMISLNQLDQLISINQTLSSVPTSSSTSGATAGGQQTSSSAAQIAERAALLTNGQNSAAAQAAFDPSQTLDLTSLNLSNGAI